LIGTIKLNGQEHPVKLGMLAFNIVEDITGIDNAFRLLGKDENLVRSSKITSALIYGAVKCGYLLKKETCPLTFEELTAAIDPLELPGILDKVYSTLDLPEAKETGDDKKKLS